MKIQIFNFIACLILTAPIAQAKVNLPKVENGKPLPANLFIELNKAINPAVVNISTETKPKVFQQNPWGGSSGDPMEELFRQFFGGGGSSRLYKSRPSFSLGTGFIISTDGLIITNSHVIDKADIINIQLSEKDEQTYPAEVIGKDPKTDIALLKIKTKRKLPTVKLGTSSKVQVGEWVAAFGNPFGHGHSMTKGIVSAIGRDIDELNLFPFIQTDASINPGNSGGPLVNMKGEVIGVNTAIDARAQGIGFAIPIDEVKSIVSQLKSNGAVSRGFLGVSMQTMNERAADELGVKQTEGVLVVDVVSDSAAEAAGIKPYDIIVKANEKKVKSSGDLSKAISRTPIGKKIKISLYRDGKLKSLYAKLKRNPESEQALNIRKPKKRTNSKTPLSSTYKKFGFELKDLTPSLKREFEIKSTGKHKAVVESVVGYSTASRAGLRPGDIIYEINRAPIFSAKEALKKLNADKKSFLIRIKRGRSFALIRLEN